MEIGNGLYDIIHVKVNTRNRTVHNNYEEDDRLKYGGTAITSFYLLSSQVLNSRADNSGLGRWA